MSNPNYHHLGLDMSETDIHHLIPSTRERQRVRHKQRYQSVHFLKKGKKVGQKIKVTLKRKKLQVFSVAPWKQLCVGSGKKAQWLMELAAFIEDPGSVRRIHMVAHNHPWLQFQGILFRPLQALHTCDIQT